MKNRVLDWLKHHGMTASVCLVGLGTVAFIVVFAAKRGIEFLPMTLIPIHLCAMLVYLDCIGALDHE